MNRQQKAYQRKKAIRASVEQAKAESFAPKSYREEKELLEVVDRWHNSPRAFVEDCLWVQPIEGGALVPFKLLEPQVKVMEAVEAQMKAGEAVRVLVLKARRGGITTLGQALAYWMTSTRSNVNGVVAAHDLETTIEVHRSTKVFYDFDERKNFGLRPDVEQSKERAFRFGEPLRSSMLVRTAAGRGIGHGLTLHVLHGSEVSRWETPDIMAGIGIALSKGPGTFGLLESTANGVGNLFYDMWQAAMEGRNEWKPVFLPWMIDHKYRLKLTGAEEEAWDAGRWEWDSEEEEKYSVEHRLDAGQVKWRRRQLASPDMMRAGRPPEDVFREQYPATAEEAFVTSGSHFFMLSPLRQLKEGPKGVRAPKYRGFIRNAVSLKDRSGSDRTPLKPVVEEHRFGPLWVWEEPKKGEDYVVGADVAEGLERGDDSVAVVMKRSKLEVVAKWRGAKVDPDEFGWLCCLIGTWYNVGGSGWGVPALLGIESNGPGVSSNLAAKRLGYPRLWIDRGVDSISKMEKDRYGWRTTEASRATALFALEAEVRQGTMVIPSEEFYREASVFVMKASESGRKARPEAQQGKHDDEVMAMAIALQMHINGGALRKLKKETVNEDALLINPRTVSDKIVLAGTKRSRGYDWW